MKKKMNTYAVEYLVFKDRDTKEIDAEEQIVDDDGFLTFYNGNDEDLYIVAVFPPGVWLNCLRISLPGTPQTHAGPLLS